MGKKKIPKKTKELSVAIAESSSIGTAEPQLTPRKRGRPRKIVEKTESEEIKAGAEAAQEVTESESKKAKMSEEKEEEEEQQQQQRKEVPISPSTKEEGRGQSAAERLELPKGPPRSRARRKSKPRKSS